MSAMPLKKDVPDDSGVSVGPISITSSCWISYRRVSIGISVGVVDGEGVKVGGGCVGVKAAVGISVAVCVSVAVGEAK